MIDFLDEMFESAINTVDKIHEEFSKNVELASLEKELAIAYQNYGQAIYDNCDGAVITTLKGIIDQLIAKRDEILKLIHEKEVAAQEAKEAREAEKSRGTFCPNCGKKCMTGDKFCCNCGSKLRQ